MRSLMNPYLTLSLLFLILVFPQSVKANSWIQSKGNKAPSLSVEQSLWGMIGLPLGGKEWSLEQKIENIAKAGFDSIQGNVTSVEEAQKLAKLAKAKGLTLTLRASIKSQEELLKAIKVVKASGARGLIVEIKKTFASLEQGQLMIEYLIRECKKAGVAYYLDIHRNSLTQDLGKVATWAREVKGIQFDADLSHLVSAYDLGWKLSPQMAQAFDLILGKAGMVDGRISNGQQLQIDIGPKGDHPQAKRFQAWWKKAMVNWLKTAGNEDVFVFRSELGPPPYSITDLKGKEISDRWAQAQVLRNIAIRTWNEAVKEAGKGLAYSKKKPKSSKMDLTVKKSPILTIRGVSNRVGDFYLAGQPAQPDLEKAVKELGVKTVINLRKDVELFGLGFEEDYTIELLKAKYIHLQTGPMVIDDELCEKFLEACRKAPRPILIHGSNGNRVWGMWALYLAMDHGVSIDDTKAQATKLGVKKLVVEDYVRKYVAKQK